MFRVFDPTASVDFQIGVDEFGIAGSTRHADTVIGAYHWCEVADHDDKVFPVSGIADKGENRIVGVIGL